MPIIEVRDLKKIYNKGQETEVQALKGINLDLQKGDLCSIIGVSGSGKSTLLHILGCIDKATSGTYILENEIISNKNDIQLAKLRNKKFGFVLQEFGLIEDENVYQNIYTPLLFSKPKTKGRKNIEVLMKKLEIDNLKNKKVNKLSGGQRQRVAIARALVNDPDIILADEPTGSLDSKTAENIMNIFIELNKIGKTIIIVTHNLEIANKTKRKFIMKDGIIEEKIK